MFCKINWVNHKLERSNLNYLKSKHHNKWKEFLLPPPPYLISEYAPVKCTLVYMWEANKFRSSSHKHHMGLNHRLIHGLNKYLIAATKTNFVDTVCPRSLYPFYVVTHYIKWAKTSWTYSSIVFWSIHINL